MMRGKLGAALVAAVVFGVVGTSPAQAETFTTKTLHFAVSVGPNDDVDCDIIGDLYTPSGASASDPRPSILTTNGFGGSKDDQATFAKYYAAHGYVVLSYSGLGFGGSGCQITLDDPDYDGKAASQLVTFLGGGKAAVDGTKIDYVKQDALGSDGEHHAFDPRVGMIGGSYGGEIQFAVAGIDPRVDTIVPIITWNDLAYSLAPNNTSAYTGVSYMTPGIEKFDWVSLFFGVGIEDGLTGAMADPTRDVGCPNFDTRACPAKAQMDAQGSPDASTISFARHASVASYMDQIKIPTLLSQGEGDTLFNLREATATYQALQRQGTPVKMIWKFGGHSGPDAPGDLDAANPDGTYQWHAYQQWFDHYLKDDPAAPSLDFTYFRDWVSYTGNPTPAYGRAPQYPVAAPTKLYLSDTDALTSDPTKVVAGDAMFATTTGGTTSYTETSAIDQTRPVTDAPGSFAEFETPALADDTDVIGIPSVTLRLDAPLSQTAGQAMDSQQLALFFKLYDIAPDGTITLSHRVISPVRIANPSVPVTVQLPGTVHRFPKGHRIALTISAGDTAYRTNNVAGPVTIHTDPAHPGVLSLPIVAADKEGAVVDASVPLPPTTTTSTPPVTQTETVTTTTTTPPTTVTTTTPASTITTSGPPETETVTTTTPPPSASTETVTTTTPPPSASTETVTTTTPPPSASTQTVTTTTPPPSASTETVTTTTPRPSAETVTTTSPPATSTVTTTSPPAATPKARVCGSRRAFDVRVRQAYRKQLASAKVTVDGKPLTTLSDGKTTFHLSLAGRRAATVSVAIAMTLKNGKTVTDTRHYRTCAT